METYNKQHIMDLIQPHSNCTLEDNGNVKKDVLQELTVAQDYLGTDEIRELLIADSGNDGTAKQFFANSIDSKHILNILLEIVKEDYSTDARINGAYWISQFNIELLKEVEDTLLVLQKQESFIVAHILVALGKIKSKEGLKYLIENIIKPEMYWVSEALKYYLYE
ncbi:MAG TPA: hypothetical protein VF941_20695 [Clostridia bacterium]